MTFSSIASFSRALCSGDSLFIRSLRPIDLVPLTRARRFAFAGKAPKETAEGCSPGARTRRDEDCDGAEARREEKAPRHGADGMRMSRAAKERAEDAKDYHLRQAIIR